jgi:RNA polymerase sigma-70 factor (ECF subfamily)
VTGRDDEQELVARLIAASLAGDADAFRQLVELKRDQVFRTAYQHLGRVDDARSVAQGVFVRLWRSLHLYDPKRRFDTWLYQVTVNAAIDHHRRQAARGVEVEFRETFDPETGAPPTAVAPDAADAPSGAAEVQRILFELAGELPQAQRTAFILREIEGLSTAEVAEVLEQSESTVRNHVFQARKTLRRVLERRYPEYGPRRARTREEEPS